MGQRKSTTGDFSKTKGEVLQLEIRTPQRLNLQRLDDPPAWKAESIEVMFGIGALRTFYGL